MMLVGRDAFVEYKYNLLNHNNVNMSMNYSKQMYSIRMVMHD